MGTSAGWIPEVRPRGPCAVFRDAATAPGGCPRRPPPPRRPSCRSPHLPTGCPQLSAFPRLGSQMSCLLPSYAVGIFHFVSYWFCTFLTGLIQETIDLVSTLI